VAFLFFSMIGLLFGNARSVPPGKTGAPGESTCAERHSSITAATRGSLKAVSSREFYPAAACDVPPTARAYVLNVTAAPLGPLPAVTLYPAGTPLPETGTLHSPGGQTVANMALVAPGANGAVTAFASAPTHLVLDLAGYFAPGSGPNP
jgi:hypothetical protein